MDNTPASSRFKPNEREKTNTNNYAVTITALKELRPKGSQSTEWGETESTLGIQEKHHNTGNNS